MVRWCAVLLGAGLMIGPAAAQQSPPSDFPGPPNSAPLALPPPADTGKPVIFDLPPPTIAPAGASPGCTVASVCGLRLNGAVQKNGAVELNTTLFKW
jgi:hypothetical protein